METPGNNNQILARESREDIRRLENKLESLQNELAKVKLWLTILIVLANVLGVIFKAEIANRLLNLFP